MFLLGQKRYVQTPPQGSAIIDVCRTLNIVRRERGFNNATKSALLCAGKLEDYPFASSSTYTDEYLSDVKRGLMSCKVRD